MNPILSALIFQFLIAPVDQSVSPMSYEFYDGADLEYGNEYVWESSRRLVIKRHAAEGANEGG